MDNLGSADGNTDTDQFMALMTRLFNKAAAIEQEPVDTGDGVLLYTSEIHLLDLAGRFPNEGMSCLAGRLGITKGAISQTAKRLVEKGYLERVNEDGDRKTVLLRLTAAGQHAFLWHQEYHALINRRIGEEFHRLTPDEREKVFSVLARLEGVFDSCPDTRNLVTQQRTLK